VLIVYGLLLAFGWQAFGMIRGSTLVPTAALGIGMLLDFGAVLWGSLPVVAAAITPDRLLGRMTATMRFLASPRRRSGRSSAARRAIGLRRTLGVVGVLGLILSVVAMRWSLCAGIGICAVAADPRAEGG
jgi:hypothetical protein